MGRLFFPTDHRTIPVTSSEPTTMNNDQSNNDTTFHIYMEACVKNCKGQRSNTFTRLSPDVQIDCNTVDEFKEKLWEIFSEHLI